MGRKSGGWDVTRIQYLDGSVSEPQPTPTLYDPLNPARPILFSKDLGDPEMGTVLHWHIQHCAHCTLGSKLPPAPFGQADRRHCAEYWGIIDEYREYEVIYAMRGNP